MNIFKKFFQARNVKYFGLETTFYTAEHLPDPLNVKINPTQTNLQYIKVILLYPTQPNERGYP